MSRYLIGGQAAGQAPLPPQAEHVWWHQFYFATDHGLRQPETSGTTSVFTGVIQRLVGDPPPPGLWDAERAAY